MTNATENGCYESAVKRLDGTIRTVHYDEPEEKNTIQSLQTTIKTARRAEWKWHNSIRQPRRPEKHLAMHESNRITDAVQHYSTQG